MNQKRKFQQTCKDHRNFLCFLRLLAAKGIPTLIAILFDSISPASYKNISYLVELLATSGNQIKVLLTANLLHYSIAVHALTLTTALFSFSLFSHLHLFLFLLLLFILAVVCINWENQHPHHMGHLTFHKSQLWIFMVYCHTFNQVWQLANSYE